jgi:hypothetical protein
MLGMYGIALLKEIGFKEVYCSYKQNSREDLIKEFGAIPIFDGIRLLIYIAYVETFLLIVK